MSTERPTAEQMSEVLDFIHDLAVKAASEDGIPPRVDAALDQIASLARYKMMVIPRPKTQPEG